MKIGELWRFHSGVAIRSYYGWLSDSDAEALPIHVKPGSYFLVLAQEPHPHKFHISTDVLKVYWLDGQKAIYIPFTSLKHAHYIGGTGESH